MKMLKAFFSPRVLSGCCGRTRHMAVVAGAGGDPRCLVCCARDGRWGLPSIRMPTGIEGGGCQTCYARWACRRSGPRAASSPEDSGQRGKRRFTGALVLRPDSVAGTLRVRTLLCLGSTSCPQLQTYLQAEASSGPEFLIYLHFLMMHGQLCSLSLTALPQPPIYTHTDFCQ